MSEKFPEQVNITMTLAESDAWRPEIFGWSRAILPFYRAVAAELADGAACAEVGVYEGRSVLFLDEELRTLGKHACEIFAIDSWKWPAALEGWQIHTAARRRRLKGHLFPMLHAYRQESIAAARLFLDASLDLVFLDDDHDHPAPANGIAAWWPKVKPGGILAGHDYDSKFPGVILAVDHFCKEKAHAAAKRGEGLDLRGPSLFHDVWWVRR